MITIEAKNLGNLMNMANAFPEISQLYVDKAIVLSIGQVARNTQPLIPVDTGNLKNSFIPQFQPFVGWLGSIVNYAFDVHNLYSVGTPYRHPSKNKNAVAGFFTIGVHSSKDQIDKNFRDALNNITSALYNKL